MSELPEGSGHADRMLWMAAGVVAVSAFVALALIPFWPGAEGLSRPSDGSSDNQMSTAPSNSQNVNEHVNELLNRARLALDADMLLEPRNVSAWQLYREVISLEPGNAAALAGLSMVADRLLEAAVGDSPSATARDPVKLATMILHTLPDHAGARAVIDRVERSAADSGKPLPAAPSPAGNGDGSSESTTQPAITVAATADLHVTKPPNDAIPDVYEAFERSLKAGDLIVPSERNAKELVGVMRVLDKTHELTSRAERELFEAFIRRFELSFDDLETSSASEWLREADLLGVDSARVARAREQLARFKEAVETALPVPAEQLTLIEYVAPEYPKAELKHGVEGWVDVEFTVTREGRTRDIAVTNASHETTFTNEAVFAVALWRFEPQRIMGRPVDQRAYTRIRFEIE